ncbi:MAG: pyridoxal-dependent decarboxylase [Planctomycetes bacterium]|nr:pyridoxal-dependent decarboxylase [Planctomycetota bacterium]
MTRPDEPAMRVRPPDASFSPDAFRRAGHALVDRLADHLERARRRELPALPRVDTDAERARWRLSAAPRGLDALPALIDEVVLRSNHLHHPGYVGHQVSAPHPIAALGELVAGFLNNGMAVYEMGPAATAIERELVAWFARELGLPADADGVFTSGGSIGNLTALLAMRELRAGDSAWEHGTRGKPQLCVLVSEQAHYSIARATRILGWGRDGALGVAVDAQYRMRVDALEERLARAREDGFQVLGVVGSACTTATGAFDPLERVADVCAREGLWLHVDGAHGSPAALSPKYRALVAGIERADSVVADAHKMLLVPALSTAVLFRRGRDSWATFAQEATYLFSGNSWDHAQRTLECTKRMLALPLYLLLECVGRDELARHVERCFDLARTFAAQLRAADDFELAVEPQANIVCFRHTPRGAEDLDGLQARLRERVLARERFYLVQTRLDGALWLRTTLINPFTTEADLAELLDALRAAARAT